VVVAAEAAALAVVAEAAALAVVAEEAAQLVAVAEAAVAGVDDGNDRRRTMNARGDLQ
jgi:hypothetical protein